ncbi:DUF6671 family protein [Microbulbifer sp. YPW1]|uniref:DUF6671 family protein n=1 Tax=Microbulbifer sp. YPW1 TaxID=2745199 RepID=UPI00351A0F8D
MEPDYWQTAVERGLPCAWCSEPTELVKILIKKCRQCGFTERQPVHKPMQTRASASGVIRSTVTAAAIGAGAYHKYLQRLNFL